MIETKWKKAGSWKALLAAMLLVCLGAVPGAFGAETLVSTGVELADALAAVQAGDTIVLHDGVWADADILLSGYGTAALPIKLRAQTLGRVQLTGTSRLRLSGTYLIVDGLTFTNGYRTSGDVIAFQNTSGSAAYNSRVTGCTIVDYNPPDGRNDTKWVSLYGLSNRVDNCYFKGKANVGATVIVWLDYVPADQPNYHQVDHNYFGPRPALGTNGSNGGESVRVGTSEFSFNISRTTVEGNYFEQCNGDVEIISSKSCENIYRRNTFVDSEGALSLRHGNRSLVEGNYFFGHHKTNTGGVRIVGDDHRVQNNYFQDLAGTSSRAPLAIMQGLVDSPLNGYFQVHRATVAFNTFVNCTNTLYLGLVGTLSGTTNTTTLPPTDCVIANNLILQPAGKIVDQRITPVNLLWEGNIFFGATLNIPTNAGIAQISPLLELAPDNLWRPATNSPALGAAQGIYSLVTQDFEGQARPVAKDVGCDQAAVTPVVYPPLTVANVGPLWMRVAGTFLTWNPPGPITYGTPLSSAQLNASANAAGTLVYDPPAGTVLNAGSNQTLTMVFTPTDLINFTVATQTVALDVIKALPAITWANPADIAYGVTLGATQLNASASIPGVFSYNPPGGTLLNASNAQVLSVTFTPAAATNYFAATSNVLINVAKAAPVITWTPPSSIEQGVALSAAQLNATASVPGVFVYAPPLGTVLAAGSGQSLSASFTPGDTNNYTSVSRTVPLNVTIGGKTVPSLTWPAPAPILFGTPLGALQLNATASAPGTFSYTPSLGTVLPAGNSQTLSVTFTPSNAATYTSASKTVSIDVALLSSNSIVRIAYIVPTNRVAQSHAVNTLRGLVAQYREFFADQMERNGFGRKTFNVETEPDGVTPLINVLSVPVTDSHLRNDIYGNRVLAAATNAGLTIGAPGQIWWLLAESHVEQADGTLSGGFEVGHFSNLPTVASGWVVSGGDALALSRPIYQTNAAFYDGLVLPELGPFPLVQDVSFPWFQGFTISGSSSSAVGAGLRSLGQAFGLDHDFRNDENFNGNLMGFGFRGLRGTLFPSLFRYNYCALSFGAALELSVNPFFNPGRLATDLTPPTVSVSTSGPRTPVAGLLGISFSAADDRGLHAALLTWESDADFILVAEQALSGTNASGTFQVPYFYSQVTNRFRVTVLDRFGNRSVAQTSIVPAAAVNHAPQPFVRVNPLIAGPGEDVVLDASETFDPEHGAGLLEVEWDLDGDGFFDTPFSSELSYVAHYDTVGNRLVRARITDPAGDVAFSAPVAVSIRPCAVSQLSPALKSHGYGVSTGTVKVAVGPKCRWSVFNTNSWITILSAPEIAGSGTLQYSLEANPEFFGRQGLLLVGDAWLTVTQAPAVCTYSFSPTNRFHGYGTGGSTFKINTKTSCEWAVVNTNSWITITNRLTGSNTTTLGYTVTENRVPVRRVGYVTLGEEAFTVTQWGTNCEFTLNPSGWVHSENSETGLVTVSTGSILGGSSCGWNVVNTNTWITLTNGDSGTGSGSFGYRVAPNLGAVPRTGVLTVGSETFTVMQGVCSYSIDPPGFAHVFLAQTSSVAVTAGAVCAWSVSNTNGWIHFLSPTAGAGAGLVTYYVEKNPTSNPRSATFTVAGFDYVLTQDGKPCIYEIDGEVFAYQHPEGESFLDVQVNAEPGCEWQVINPASWIHVPDGVFEGTNIVTYQVDANPGPARSASLTIAGVTHVVSQDSGVRDVRITDLTLASGQIGSTFVRLDAHGGENSLEFSFCFNTNLLAYSSALLMPTAPFGAVLSIDDSQAADGRVGLTAAMPPGFSMPAGTGLVVQVSFSAAAVNGRPNTTISFCDTPVLHRVRDAAGQTVTSSFGTNLVRIIGICTLGESLDAPELVWTSGAVPWSCQTNYTHDLASAAASGVTPDNGESYMETTVYGPGVLSFWWKVSSEPSNDRLRLYMDGTEQYRISGEVDWEWRTFNVPVGVHVFRWRYNKNATIAAGQDRGYVDQVAYVPSPPSIATQPVSQSVDSGTTVNFSVLAGGQPPITYQWLFNHIPLADGGGVSGAQTPTLTLANVQTVQAGFYSVMVATPQGNINSASATLAVAQVLPLPVALDAESFTWTTNGAAAWAGQSDVTHDGLDAARSGNITHSQSTAFQTILTGPGTVKFWWKVSSETNKDILTFSVNGTAQATASGEVDWQQKTVAIGTGTRTLLWNYAKNSSVSVGQDRVWVDQFEFIPTPVTITTHPTNLVADQGANATFVVAVSGTPPVTYQWRSNGTNLPGATGATLVISNVQPAQSGLYSVVANNGAGSATSSNASLFVNQTVPLSDAVDAPTLGWTTNGSPYWVGQIAVSHDGSDAARSGRIADSGTSSLLTTVTGPGTISFWWKVSSQTNSDKLTLYIGGSAQENISGEADWTWRSWTVASGSQTIEWRYTKNASGAAGQDFGWVDQIRYVANSTPTAPFFAIQPTNRTAVAPATVNFSGMAGGSATLSYQWFFNGVAMTNGGGASGATTTNLTLTSAGAAQNGNYYLVVTNSAGSATSTVATLAMITAPLITTQPASTNVVAGATVTFNVSAIGLAPLSYQWQRDGANISNGGKFGGATTATLTIANAQTSEQGTYSVTVSNSAGVASSLFSGGTLTIWDAARTAAVTNGQNTALEAVVTGPGTIKFSWKVSSQTNSDMFRFSVGGIDQSAISGEVDWRNETFAVPAGPQLLQWRYTKDASGSAGQDAGYVDNVEFAATGALTAPIVISQPVNRSVAAGDTITFDSGVNGSTPLFYQWRLNGAALQNGGGISGVKMPHLTLSGLQAGQGGNYSLFVSNAAGVATGSNASLTVTSAPVVVSGVPVITVAPVSQGISENASVNFTVTAAGTAPFGYRWQLNGTNLSDAAGVSGISGATTASLTLSNVQLAQIGSYSVVVSNVAGVTASPLAALTVLGLSEAAGAPYIGFNQAGNASWVAQTGVTHDGTNAVRAGMIADGLNTRMEGYVDGPGTLTFWWKVSCETNNDNLRFYLGATELLRISGEVDWQQQTVSVPSGAQQLLKWRYGKDASTSVGQDAGWIDDIKYVQTGAAVAPAVTNQPVSQNVLAGATVSFAAGVSGTMPLSYQWRSNGVAIQNGNGVSGANSPRLTLTGVQPAQAANYSLFISNAASTVTTASASLGVTVVLAAPVVSSQPASQSASEGTTVSFNAVATGAAPLAYQWQFNGTNLLNGSGVSGATGTTLTLSNVSLARVGTYSVVVSNSAGVASSAHASLTMLSLAETVGAPYLNFAVTGVLPWLVQSGQTFTTQGTNDGARLFVSVPPALTSQPASQTVVAGDSASFNVGITGTPPLTVQWRLNGIPLADGNGISGATTTTLTVEGVSVVSAGSYSLLVSNAVGTAVSSNALLTVLLPPVLTAQPAAQTVNEGLSTSFSVAATGSAPLTYQWRRNGTNLVNGGNISGATSATLTLNNVQLSYAGNYSVVISNVADVTESASAHLTVIAALTLGESIGAPYLEWNTDLATPWIVQTNVTHDGEAAAQSGAISSNATTFIETLVTGPGTIRFWWKVSSQTNADVLTFSVGGSAWAQISGTVDWQKMSFALPGGQVALRWSYTKDGSGTAGLDRGWLDEVDFVPSSGPSVPVIIQEPEGVDVDPGATVMLSAQALGTAPLSYQWRFEGQDLADGGNISGSKSPVLTISSVLIAQAGAYDLVVRNPYSLDVSEQVFVNVIPVVPLPVALDTDSTNLVWLTGGYSQWRGQTNYNSDRIDAAQSGVLPNNQTNYIQTIVSGPGAITFWWKVSSQTNSDRLRFTVDGVEMASITGEGDWRQRTFAVDLPGTVLRWSYTKDAAGSAGLDRGWVDRVVFGPSAPIITNAAPDISVVDQGTTVKFTVGVTGTKPFSYQWKWNGTNLVDGNTNLPPYPGFISGAVGSSRLTISNAQPYQSGSYVCEVYNGAGVAVSVPLTLQVIPSLPLPPALNTNLVWETFGDSWWVGTTNVTHDGVMAARNGTLAGARTTTLRTTVTGPGTLSFWWKASTETNADIMTFYINGAVTAAISGNQNWQKKTYDLLDGTFVLDWEYNKNALFTNNLDQVFVDEVVFAPIAPIITNSPASQTVDQGSAVTFTAGVRGTPPLSYQWLFNGAPLPNGGGVSGATTLTLKLTSVQLFQAGLYTLQVSNSVGVSTSGVAILGVLPTFPIAEALDIADYTWTTGSPGWIGQAVTTHDGVDAARSPVTADGATATMQATIAGPGTVTYWWKVSSQTNSDALIFYIGATEQARISGEVDWQQRSFSVPAGNQTIKWAYLKNASLASGQDRGWVDQLVFIPTPPTITTHPVGTNIDQGNTATFTVAAGGTPPLYYQWSLNGVDLANGGGIGGATTPTLTLSNTLPAQAGIYTVIVANAAGTANSLGATLGVTPTVPLAQALDGSNLVWSISGSPLWVGQTAVTHDGVDAARIKDVPDSGTAAFQATITGPGTVSFWWKVSSETNNDKLVFSTNGTTALTISGEVDWQFKTVTVGAGSQILKWTYSKNASVKAGQDRAWVDEVLFGPVPPTITGQPAGQSIDAGGSAGFSVTTAGTPPFTYQWQRDGVDLANGAGISGATTSNVVLTGVQPAQAGAYRVLISGQGGATVSTPAALTVYSILTLAEALDTPGLTWTTNGTPPWVGHGAVSHDGTDAARSGAIGNSATTSMSTILNGPGTVSFWWKVSSQTNSDILFFYTNGVEALRISGEVDWQFKNVNVGSGAQTLTWTYSKNGSTVAGQDRAWVDQVSFGLVAPTIITQPSSVAVDAGSNATFTVVAAATPPIYYRWFYNGSPLADGSGISGATNASLTVSSVLPNRLGNYSVLVSNSVGTVTSASAVLSLSTNVTIEQALDGGLTYTLGGTGQPWKGQQTVTRDNVDAAQTGLCADSTYTFMKTTVTGPTPVTFWWKVSSEQDHDYLRFMVDGVDQVKISGEVDWQQVTYNVASGSHELQWRYSKNASLTSGQDRGWVDQVYLSTNTPPPVVVISLTPPTILIQPVSQTVDASDNVELSVAASSSAPLSYQWFRDVTNRVTDGGNVGGATTAALTLYNVLKAQAGNYSVIVSNSAGFVNSLSARVMVLPVIDLAEAVDAGQLFLTTGGDAPWIGHTVMTHDGVDAGRSGIVGDGQLSVMETMVNGPGTVGFWWKVSSETNADFLSFSVGGVPQARISGETGWQLFTINLSSGPQALEWTYAKNGSGSAGADRGWVDQISFTTNAVTVINTNPPAGVTGVRVSVVDNIMHLTWEASAAKTYKVFYKDHLTDPAWTLLDGEVLVTWKVVDGQIVPDVVIATTQDVLAGQTRFYKVLEY